MNRMVLTFLVGTKALKELLQNEPPWNIRTGFSTEMMTLQKK
jgi:hypothetical protein